MLPDSAVSVTGATRKAFGGGGGATRRGTTASGCWCAGSPTIAATARRRSSTRKSSPAYGSAVVGTRKEKGRVFSSPAESPPVKSVSLPRLSLAESPLP